MLSPCQPTTSESAKRGESLGAPRMRRLSHSVSFRIGESRFCVRGDPPLLECVERYYRDLPSAPGESAGFEIRWEGLECAWGSVEGNKTIGRVVDERVRPALTTFLVARMLGEADPSLLMFHGAAVSLGREGKPLLLVGHAGAGKSTLARKLVEAREDVRQVAEDELLVKTGEKPELLPFPRAAAFRPPFNAKSVFYWTSFAGSWRGKALCAVENPRPAASSLSLAKAEVIFLSGESRPRQDTATSLSPGQQGPRTRFFVTFTPDSIENDLMEAGLPLLARKRLEFCDQLDFRGTLSREETRKAFALLEENTGIVISAREIMPNSAEAGSSFPPQPSVVSLAPHEGLKELLAHRLRYSLGSSVPSGGEMFIELARCLSGARFRRLSPGGTPERTARFILEIVRD